MQVSLLSFAFSLFIVVDSLVAITNLKCDAFDKSFTDFEYCYIKAINRSYKYMNIKVKLFKVPINNISFGLNVQKRANGYRPFLYNFKIDACKYLREHKNILVNYFYGFFEKRTNINHTCPYDHDLIMEKIDTNIVEHQVVKILPVPEGDYSVTTSWYAYNKLRANISFYGSIRH